MNCQKFESVINDLAREQMMDSGQRVAALAHCDECPACGRSLEEQRQLTKKLRDLAKNMECIAAPRAVRESLANAVRSRATAPITIVTRPRWRYWAAAVAAVLLISFLGVALSLRHPSSESTVVVPPKENPSGAKEVEPVVKKADDVQPGNKAIDYRTRAAFSGVRRVPSVRRHPRQVTKPATPTVANDYSSEIATEFLPLGYGNSLSLQDGGQMVRVEVPRSTMASFGLPVNMNRAGERVKADVIFGADGAARAIRFVQ